MYLIYRQQERSIYMAAPFIYERGIVFHLQNKKKQTIICCRYSLFYFNLHLLCDPVLLIITKKLNFSTSRLTSFFIAFPLQVKNHLYLIMLLYKMFILQ